MSNSTGRSSDSRGGLILQLLCHGGRWISKLLMDRIVLADHKRIFLACLLLALLFVCTGCRAKESASPYKIIDSGIWAEEAGIESTGWIDNDHVLFITDKTLKPSGSVPVATHLTVWNPDSGKVDFYHQASLLKCVRAGEVLFREDVGKKFIPIIYRGPVNKPQEHPAPRSDMRIDSFFDCDWVPGESSGRAPIKVPHKYKLKGENYIELVELLTDASPGKMVYYEKPGAKGKPLPFYLNLSYRISYSEFLNAYVIVGEKFSRPEAITRSFFMLARDGNLSRINYPQVMLKGSVEQIYPLKCGYLAHYGQEKYKLNDPGDHGLWLINGERSSCLIVGAIHAVSVSPDGCKAAFIHSRTSNEYFSQKKPYRTVKVINFCAGESNP